MGDLASCILLTRPRGQVWDLSLIVDGLSRPDERRAVKIIKLCPDLALNVRGDSRSAFVRI